MADILDRARAAVTDRAELPGMSLMEHLEELRKRLLHSVAYLVVGFAVAYLFHSRIVALIQKMLEAEIQIAEGKNDEGIAGLQAALKMEDALKYDEPPAWMIPIRHSLGANLMRAGRFAASILRLFGACLAAGRRRDAESR